MCSIIILRRPKHLWPVVVGANRDEMLDRPWDAPSRHWPDRPTVVAGRDRLAGGSWFGRNDYGVFAAILNREDSLGPSVDKRSRGELVLEALDHPDAEAAAEAAKQAAQNTIKEVSKEAAKTAVKEASKKAAEEQLRIEKEQAEIRKRLTTSLERDLELPCFTARIDHGINSINGWFCASFLHL